MRGLKQSLRILFLADTHLGFDLPMRPRIVRRRRGHDFFANFEQALQVASSGQVDCLIHGGDLFYRSRIRAQLAMKAFEPLRRVADLGVEVYLVPGNHERGEIPFSLLATHPRIHIFNRARTFLLEKNGLRIGLAGFPCKRKHIRSHFKGLLEETGWRNVVGNGVLLCIHQSVEGATVGPSEYVFRKGEDVIRGSDIPRGILAVLSGHIHRAQILIRDLHGSPMAAPVIYPGSVERSSFAERNEVKGFFTLDIGSDGKGPVNFEKIAFQELPSRPMKIINIRQKEGPVETVIRQKLSEIPQDSVVKLRFPDATRLRPPISEAAVRRLAPTSMNVSVSFPFRTNP